MITAHSTLRLTAALIATLAFLTFAVQTMINEGHPLVAFALLFRFFTIWSNFAAAVVMAMLALGRAIPAKLMFALATALAFVALVYHTLLAPGHHPVGPDWWTNLAFHTLIPLATVMWWLAATRAEPANWRIVPYAMIAPMLYTVFALINGAATGFYPYFFLDLPQFGAAQVALNIAGLALAFAILGALLLGLRRLFASRVSAAA